MPQEKRSVIRLRVTRPSLIREARARLKFDKIASFIRKNAASSAEPIKIIFLTEKFAQGYFVPHSNRLASAFYASLHSGSSGINENGVSTQVAVDHEPIRKLDAGSRVEVPFSSQTR